MLGKELGKAKEVGQGKTIKNHTHVTNKTLKKENRQVWPKVYFTIPEIKTGHTPQMRTLELFGSTTLWLVFI